MTRYNLPYSWNTLFFDISFDCAFSVIDLRVKCQKCAPSEFDIQTTSNIPETGLTVVNLMNDVRKLHDNGMWASVPFGPNVRYASRTLINYESLLSFSKYRIFLFREFCSAGGILALWPDSTIDSSKELHLMPFCCVVTFLHGCLSWFHAWA